MLLVVAVYIVPVTVAAFHKIVVAINVVILTVVVYSVASNSVVML
jgi:hypothetical protein